MRRSHKQYDENNNVYFIGKGPIRDTLSGLNYEMAKYMYDTNAEALKQNKITASKPGYRGSITPQELMRAEYDLQEQAKAMNRAKKQMIAARAGVGIGVPIGGALAYRHYKKKQQKNASDMLNEIHMEKTAGLKNIGKRYIEMLTGSAKRAAKTNLDTAMREFDNTKIKRDNLAIWRRQVNAQRDELNKQYNHYKELKNKAIDEKTRINQNFGYYKALKNKAIAEKNSLNAIISPHSEAKNRLIAEKKRINQTSKHYKNLQNSTIAERNNLNKSISDYTSRVDKYFDEKRRLQNNIDVERWSTRKAMKDLKNNSDLPDYMKKNIRKMHFADLKSAKNELNDFKNKNEKLSLGVNKLNQNAKSTKRDKQRTIDSYGKILSNLDSVAKSKQRDIDKHIKISNMYIPARNNKQKTIDSYNKILTNLDSAAKAKQSKIDYFSDELGKIKIEQGNKKDLIDNNINPRIQALAKKEEEFRESIPDLRKQYGKERANQILTVTGTLGVGGLGAYKAKKAIQNRAENKRR